MLTTRRSTASRTLRETFSPFFGTGRRQPEHQQPWQSKNRDSSRNCQHQLKSLQFHHSKEKRNSNQSHSNRQSRHLARPKPRCKAPTKPLLTRKVAHPPDPRRPHQLINTPQSPGTSGIKPIEAFNLCTGSTTTRFVTASIATIQRKV